MTRLDKIVSDCLPCTRKEASKYIKSGCVEVSGAIVKKPEVKVDENAEIKVSGKRLCVRKYIYIMLNKPEGLISATEDEREKTVMSCLPEEYMTKGIFPAGRLDKDTTGLLILTNDGVAAHNVLSPKHHHEKTYIATSDIPFDKNDNEKVKNGIQLNDGMSCPVKLEVFEDDPKKAYVTVTEGKFHEVKRICIAIGKPLIALERCRFCGIPLDRSLERGEWRMLTDEEVKLLTELK